MKKALFYTVVLAFVAVLFYHNATLAFDGVTEESTRPEINTEVFELFADKDAKEIENSIRKAEKMRFEQFGGSTQQQIKESLEKLEKGEISLRQIFNDTFIAGDSLMNGLEIYGVLSADKLATQVSASLYHLSDNVERIISANPGNLILHYGVNMISTEEAQLESFVASYEELILTIKESLKETRIIVSGLFPVDTSIATDARFKMIESYNKALSEMCEKIGVEFLDSAKAFEGNSDYYGGDGIHLSSGFYSDVWLPFIIENKGIIG